MTTKNFCRILYFSNFECLSSLFRAFWAKKHKKTKHCFFFAKKKISPGQKKVRARAPGQVWIFVVYIKSSVNTSILVVWTQIRKIPFSEKKKNFPLWCTWGGGRFGGTHRPFFRGTSILRADEKAGDDEFAKKNCEFRKNVQIFSTTFFSKFFHMTIFSEFFWKSKMAIFGKNNVFRPFKPFLRKTRHFFSEKIVIFFDFFRIFFRKKNLQKNTKKRDFSKSASVDFRGDGKKCKKKYEKKVDFCFFKPLAKMIIYQKTQFFSSETEKVQNTVLKGERAVQNKKIVGLETFFLASRSLVSWKKLFLQILCFFVFLSFFRVFHFCKSVKKWRKNDEKKFLPDFAFFKKHHFFTKFLSF